MACEKSPSRGLKRSFLLLSFAFLGAGCASIQWKKASKNSKVGFVDQFQEERAQAFKEAKKVSQKSRPFLQAQSHQASVSSGSKSLGFQWPLKKVRINSHFGKRGKRLHQGIDLKAAIGTPVFAAQDGVVLYAGSKIRGYGKMVVVRHEGGWATVYAHHSKILVTKGQKVRQGERIALSGNTGRSSGPHLHFEIRQGLQPMNPLAFLSSPSSDVHYARESIRETNPPPRAQKGMRSRS